MTRRNTNGIKLRKRKQKISNNTKKIIQFQQVSFLRIIAAVGEGEEQKAQEWLVHYQGVQEECDDQKQQEIDQWILNGNTEQLKEMFERSLLKKEDSSIAKSSDSNVVNIQCDFYRNGTGNQC